MDYDDILNRTWDDIPEPKLLPGGGYLVRGNNVGLVKPREEGQSLKVLFNYTAKEPVAVDEDALAELGDEYDIATNELQFTIYVEKASDWDKVRKHLALHGVEIDKSKRIVDENGKLSFAKDFRNSEVVAEIGQRNYEKDTGEVVWQNTLSKFQAVGE